MFSRGRERVHWEQMGLAQSAGFFFVFVLFFVFFGFFLDLMIRRTASRYLVQMLHQA